MKRKNLEKIIVLGLLLSSSVYGTAWAAEYSQDDWHIDPENPKKLIVDNATKVIRSDNTFGGKSLSDFDVVEITYKPTGSGGENRAFGVYSAQYDIPNTNIIVTVEYNAETDNNDALHLTNHYTEFNVGNFTAHVKSKGSDIFNISRDSTTNSGVTINGNVTGIVEIGNGLRANASIKGDNTATITINGDTNIILNADSANNLFTSYITKRPFYTTAIWAGTETYYNSDCPDASFDKLYGLVNIWNEKSEGQGIIYLQGTTTLTLNGKENFGILAGKNGNITVNDLYITANKNDSYGVSAAEKNITYGSDDSENKYGSTVTLNGDTNKIYMVETDENGNIKLDENGNPVQTEGSKAIYADSQYGVVQSGANGIGNIDIVGDIEACNGGTIKLDVNGAEQNSLQGDIIAYGTQSNKKASVNLTTRANMEYQGDALAANGGVVDVTLGNGSVWSGRADDYQDAMSPEWSASHADKLKTKFSGEVAKNGTVNVDMGTDSIWNVTGQSWITNLKGENNYIIMDGVNTGGYALHIEKIENANTFVMNVRPNATGDMLYIKDGTGAKQDLVINNSAEVLEHMDVGDAVRFATVTNAGRGFNNGEFVDMPAQTFGRSTRISDAGIFNVDFDIAYNDYNTEMTGDVSAGHDEAYNGNDFTVDKPGDAYVDEVYGKEDAKNVYIVRKSVTKDNQSDAGKTIINMSRANYKNAIYMDRLNKRMGEMRYVDGEEEQGLWVRLRHDRIGQSGDFRSMNTMYELGYDVKQPTTSGEHRIGMAIDYMDGSTTYDDILGKGETKRYGLWLYDTWLGEKGHYTDYIVKWGHLSNEFDISAKTSGEKISGDYSNNVFSVSAEYGKKNDMGNNWYFEPQAQLQLARVTGADYVTTQGSKVSVDGINSLIGRAGFRIGRDMNENSTVYLKADLLHEFMGDQTVTAADATGTLREEFDNKGTWYDVGFGFAAKMSKNSYAFLDFERSFGNDNDETYQINAGLQWSF